MKDHNLGMGGVIRNTVFLLLSRGIQIVAGFFIVIAVARYLPIEEYGEYSFVIALASSITALTYFGIQQVVIREMAQDMARAPHWFGVAIQLRGMISILVILGFVLAMWFMDVSSSVAYGVTIALVSEIFLSFNMLLKAVFQAFERMVYETALTIAFYVMVSSGIAVVILLDLGYLWLLAVAAAANIIQLVIASFITAARFVRPKMTLDTKTFLTFFKYTSVVGIGIFLYQNLLKVNVLMLKWLSGAADVALFQAPHNLILQMSIIPASVVAALYPVLSRSLVSEPSRVPLIYEKMFKYLFVFSFIISVYLAAFSREIITVVFGSKFIDSAYAMTILSLAFIPLTMDVFMNSILIAINKQKYSVFYGGGALAANVIGAFFLIPRYGYVGASYLAVFSFTFLFICSLFFVGRCGFPPVFGKIAMKTALIALASFVLILLLKPLSILLAVPSVAALYLFLLFVTGIIPAEDVLMLKEALRLKYNKGKVR